MKAWIGLLYTNLKAQVKGKWAIIPHLTCTMAPGSDALCHRSCGQTFTDLYNRDVRGIGING